MRPQMTFQDWCIQNRAYLLLHFYQQGENPLPPEEIGFSSGKTVIFRCHVCGLTWRRSLNKATRVPFTRDCPFCAHRRPSPFYNLATEYPELAEEWDGENNPLSPSTYLPNSHSKVSWRCVNGHRWEAAIHDRAETVTAARKSGRPVCPFCSGEKVSPTYNLVAKFPEIAREWDYERNEGKKPEDFSPGTNQAAWWKCSYDPSHRWKARIANRTVLGRGCPLCSKEFKISYPARTLFYYLRQVCPDCVCEAPFGRYKLDILLPGRKLVIEHDGFYYHSGKAEKERAQRKDRALRGAGYQVLRVADRRDLPQPVLSQGDTLLYRFDERELYLDSMLAAVFARLGLPPLDFDHRRDRYEIEQLYFHERKKHTLAVEHPELAGEWSPQNPMGPDAVFSGSSRKVWWRCPTCRREYQATVANRAKNRSNCPFCAHRRAHEETCLATLRPDIAGQWHPELNLPLTPHDVVPGSEKEVFWLCGEGHVWRASVLSRTGPRGGICPICHPWIRYGRPTSQPMDPSLVGLWHPTKNLPLTPDSLTSRSNRRVWWRCEKGHEWQGSVNNLRSLPPPKRCPFCNDRAVCADNSLQARYPELAREWDERNLPLTPDKVLYCSGKRCWWRRGAFVWQATIKERLRKNEGIPRSQSLLCDPQLRLSVTHPELAAQWDPVKNGSLTPDQVTARSSKKVWWLCAYGHSWQTAPLKRLRGDGCPFCSGRRPSEEYCLQALYPGIAAQWHPAKNGSLTPRDVTPGSGRAVWWLCEKGHEWRSSISNRCRRGHNCPRCADRSKRHGSLVEERPDLLPEWDGKNNGSSAWDCPARSNKKVWWRCSVCGHAWQATPDSRFSGSGCPVCAKKRRRITDLAEAPRQGPPRWI